MIVFNVINNVCPFPHKTFQTESETCHIVHWGMVMFWNVVNWPWLWIKQRILDYRPRIRSISELSVVCQRNATAIITDKGNQEGVQGDCADSTSVANWQEGSELLSQAMMIDCDRICFNLSHIS